MIERLADGIFRYSAKDFVKDCKDGVLTDYDGYGYLATYDEISNIVVKPGRVKTEEIKHGWPYVVFYRNKGRRG